MKWVSLQLRLYCDEILWACWAFLPLTTINNKPLFCPQRDKKIVNGLLHFLMKTWGKSQRNMFNGPALIFPPPVF